MADSHLPVRSEDPSRLENPIRAQAWLDLTEFSKKQGIPAIIMGIGTFITALVTGQIKSTGSALLLIMCSVLVGVVLYAVIAFLRAPFIVMSQQHREIADLRKRLLNLSLAPKNLDLASKLLPTAAPPEPVPEANPVCLRCETVICVRESEMFTDWNNDLPVLEEFIYRARVAVIDNKGSRDLRVGTAHNVTARIIYPNSSGLAYEIARGAWLSEDSSKINLYPSRIRRLILGVVPQRGPIALHAVELNETSRGLSCELVALNDREMTVSVTLESEGRPLKEWEIPLEMSQFFEKVSTGEGSSN